MDVVGFLFDYIFRDPSIPPRFRKLYEGLQLPILKAALADPSFFTDSRNAARRLLEGLADAAIGADDDEAYGEALEHLATSIDESDSRGVRPGRGCVRVRMRNAEEIHRRMAEARLARAMQPQRGRGLGRRRRATPIVREYGCSFATSSPELDISLRCARLCRHRLGRLPDATSGRPKASRSDSISCGGQDARTTCCGRFAAKGRTAQKAALSKMIPSHRSPTARRRCRGAGGQREDEALPRLRSTTCTSRRSSRQRGQVAGRATTTWDPPMPAFLARKKIGNSARFRRRSRPGHVARLRPGRNVASRRG